MPSSAGSLGNTEQNNVSALKEFTRPMGEEEESGGGKARGVGGSQGQTTDSAISCLAAPWIQHLCPYCGMRLGTECK